MLGKIPQKVNAIIIDSVDKRGVDINEKEMMNKNGGIGNKSSNLLV